jgi:hypothetical protein
MRILTLATLVIIISGCSGNEAADGDKPDGLVAMRAGQVLASASEPFMLKASFQLSPTQAGPAGIASLGSGGACLIADLNAINLPNDTPSCTADAQCQKGLPQGHFGYCVANKCWVRPGPPTQMCDRTIDRGGVPFALGQHWLPPKDSASGATHIDVSHVYRLPGAAGKQFGWRVHSCLNGLKADGNSNSACANQPGEKQIDDGPVRLVG